MFQVIQIAWQIADGDALGRAGRRARLDLVRIAIRRQPPPARPVMPPDDSAPVHVRAGRNLRRYQVACQKNTASRTPKQADVGYPILPHIHMDGAENAGLRLGATPDRPVLVILLPQREQSGRGHCTGDIQSPHGRIKPEKMPAHPRGSKCSPDTSASHTFRPIAISLPDRVPPSPFRTYSTRGERTREGRMLKIRTP